MIKKVAQTTLAGALLAGSFATHAEINGNIALSTDYVFRGVSQTDNQAAISGGFDYGHESGFYVGTWASNVDSQLFNDGTDPQIELDLYGGYGGELDNGFGYDVGVIRYVYPGSSKANTTEFYAGASYSYFSAKFSYSDELNFVSAGESGYYLEGGADFDLPYDAALSLHVGYSDGDAFDVTGGVDSSYIDYSIGVSKEVAGVGLGLTYSDTNDDGEDNFGNIADSRLVFSISKEM